MNAEQKKRAEELESVFSSKLDKKYNDIEKANMPSILCEEAFLAGYEAGLNDPEALGGLLDLTLNTLKLEIIRLKISEPYIQKIVIKNLETLRAEILEFKERGQK